MPLKHILFESLIFLWKKIVGFGYLIAIRGVKHTNIFEQTNSSCSCWCTDYADVILANKLEFFRYIFVKWNAIPKQAVCIFCGYFKYILLVCLNF